MGAGNSVGSVDKTARSERNTASALNRVSAVSLPNFTLEPLGPAGGRAKPFS